MKNKRILSRTTISNMFAKSEIHRECYNRLLSKVEKDGYSSLLVHPDFQEAHNRGGQYFVYIEISGLFYGTPFPELYIKRCIANGNIKSNEICAINSEGEFFKYS